MNKNQVVLNRSINLKLEDYMLSFIFSNNQNKAFYRTSFEHFHANFEFHFIISGECILKTKDTVNVLKKNTVLIIPPKTPHLITEYSEDCKKADFRMSVVAEGRGRAVLPFETDRITMLTERIKTVGYAEEFLEAIRYSGKNGEVLTKSILALMYFSILSDIGFDDSKTAKSEVPGVFYDYVNIEDFLMQSYMYPITLKEVANKTGFTPTHIGRIIKKNYGMSYSDLILTMRMSQAVKLIENGEGVLEISKKLGYASYNGFALAFKRYYKISPEQMRKQIEKGDFKSI